MNIDKNVEVMQSFNELEAYVNEVKRLSEEGHDYTSVELYNAAADILAQANSFLNKLEDSDDNLDVETSSLPDIDSLFPESPVTDYVNARVEFALGDDSRENVTKMVKAAEAISEMTVYEDEEEAECEVECTRDTCICVEQSLHEYITSVDTAMTEEINYMMDMIDEAFTDTDVFEGEDIELLRFYLSHLPMNTKADVDVMSERAVVLAYKQRKMAQGNL